MNATKEDLQLKRDFMLQMEKSQETFNEMSSKLSSSIESLGKGINEGLGLLAMALNPTVGSQGYSPTPLNTPQGHASNMGSTVPHHPYRFNGNIHHAGPSGDRFSQMLFAEENYRDL